MKVHTWLSDPLSRIIGNALVEVDAGEVADVEAMLKTIDGDSVGHFGLTATLVATEGFDVAQLAKDLKSKRSWSGQFGYPNASTLRDTKRYYHVKVGRD